MKKLLSLLALLLITTTAVFAQSIDDAYKNIGKSEKELTKFLDDNKLKHVVEYDSTTKYLSITDQVGYSIDNGKVSSFIMIGVGQDQSIQLAETIDKRFSPKYVGVGKNGMEYYYVDYINKHYIYLTFKKNDDDKMVYVFIASPTKL